MSSLPDRLDGIIPQRHQCRGDPDPSKQSIVPNCSELSLSSDAGDLKDRTAGPHERRLIGLRPGTDNFFPKGIYR